MGTNWNYTQGIQPYDFSQWNTASWTQNYWNNSAGSGSASKSESASDSAQNWFKKREDSLNAIQQRVEENKKLRELDKAKNALMKAYCPKETISELKDIQAKIQKNKKKNGSSSYVVSRKSQGTWGKIGRWFSNAGTAFVNIGKSLIGMEPDGSINVGKLAKNALITACAIGACFIPVVGPIIGYGLMAYGIYQGGKNVIKGINQLKRAKTDEEIDKAQQDICGGAFITGASALGLRGVGKAFRLKNPSVASSATVRTSMAGRTVEYVSNLRRDITVNAWRSTKAAMSADKALIATKGGGVKGFAKAYGNKVSSAWNNFNDWETTYNNRYDMMKTSLKSKVAELTQKIKTETDPVKKALLMQEKKMAVSNLKELYSLGVKIKTKADYDKLVSENSSVTNRELASSYTRNASGNYDVNGVFVSKADFENWRALMNRNQSNYNSSLSKLIDAKKNTMWKYAGQPDKHMTQLNDYLPVRNANKKWWKISSWRKNPYQLEIGGGSAKWKESMGLMLTSAPAVGTIGINNALNKSTYSTPLMFGEDLTPEMTEQRLTNYDAMLKQYEQIKAAIDAAKTKEELMAIETNLKAMNEQTQQQQQQAAEQQ